MQQFGQSENPHNTWKSIFLYRVLVLTSWCMLPILSYDNLFKVFPKEDFSQESKTKIKITTTEGEKQF